MKKFWNWLTSNHCGHEEECEHKPAQPKPPTREERIAKMREIIEKQDKELTADCEKKKATFLQAQASVPKTKVILVTDKGEFDTDPFEPSVSYHIDRYSFGDHHYRDELDRLEAKTHRVMVHYNETTSRQAAEWFAKNWGMEKPMNFHTHMGMIINHNQEETYHHQKMDVLIPKREIKLIKYVEVK